MKDEGWRMKDEGWKSKEDGWKLKEEGFYSCLRGFESWWTDWQTDIGDFRVTIRTENNVSHWEIPLGLDLGLTEVTVSTGGAARAGVTNVAAGLLLQLVPAVELLPGWQ